MEQKRILVVDDNASNLKLFTLLLRAPGYEVRTAADARQTFDVLTSFRPDLILLDLQLPDIDGFELTRRLKADPEMKSVPIIAVTAYAMKGDEERARAAGADGYVSKPVDREVFRTTVRRSLGLGETHDEK